MLAGDDRDMREAIDDKVLNGRWFGSHKEVLQRRTLIRGLRRIPVSVYFLEK
jgi:hypothetical protein